MNVKFSAVKFKGEFMADAEGSRQQLEGVLRGSVEQLDEDLLSYLVATVQDATAEGTSLKDNVGPILLDAGVQEDELDALCARLAAICPQQPAAAGKAPAQSTASGPQKLSSSIHMAAGVGTGTDTAEGEQVGSKPPSRPESPAPGGRKARPKRQSKGKAQGGVAAREAEVTVTWAVSRFWADLDAQTARRRDIDVRNVGIEISGQELLQGADIRLQAGRRYALLGSNGVGKTTLLRTLTGGKLLGPHLRTLLVDQEDAGDQRTALETVLGADSELGHLLEWEQRLQHALDSGCSDAVELAVLGYRAHRADALEVQTHNTADRLSRTRGHAARGVWKQAETAAEEAREMLARAEAGEKVSIGDAAQEAAGMLLEIRESLRLKGGAEEARSKAATILAGLGFSHTQMCDERTSSLSGGWRMRTALARALFAGPELLMLDEPTNHLDMRAVLWLEKWLLAGAERGDFSILVVVSHDRRFLNAIATDVIHFTHLQLRYYVGDYDTFEGVVEEVALSRARLAESIERRKEQIQKSIDWMLKKARESGDDRRLKQVASRRKKLENRMGLERSAKGTRFKLNRDLAGKHLKARQDVVVEAPDKEVVWNLPVGDSLGYYGPLLQLDDVTAGYDNGVGVVSDVTLDVDMSSRICIMGENGGGKSTVLSTIAGLLPPLKGTVTTHRLLRVAFFSQHLVDTLDPATSSLAHLQAAAPAVKEQELRAHLGKFGIKGSLATQPVNLLSGGQKVRAVLAALTWTPPHILLLDEPTNHLDLNSVQALAMALSEFAGGVVLVSHDRLLMAEVGTDFYAVRGGKLVTLEDGVDEYVQMIMDQSDADV